ncbi:MAG: hypothetical protein P1U40_14040 [Coxiellaceae bacterium]|nr:hypothetical protein [Coxiellaceae bacterium]
MSLVSQKVCIKDYPLSPAPTATRPFETVTAGDMHGNAMKLIYILIKEGILTISEDQLKTLWQIYEHPRRDLTADQIDLFQTILREGEYTKSCALRLIGDLLADRGRNDWFTLQVLQAMQEHGIDFEIDISNHDMGFIEYMRGGRPYHKPRDSLNGLRYAVANPIIPQVNKEAVKDLYERVYLKHLKALSYHFDPDGNPPITIFTHAPVGLETVDGVARELAVTFDESTPTLLAASIDRINAEFTERMQRHDLTVLRLLNNPRSHLHSLIWNRAGDAALMNGRMIKPNRFDILVKKLRLQPDNKSYSVTFVHGHDGVYTPKEPNRVNIDSKLGMGERRHLTSDYLSYRQPGGLVLAADKARGCGESKVEPDVTEPLAAAAVPAPAPALKSVSDVRCMSTRRVLSALFSHKRHEGGEAHDGTEAVKEAKGNEAKTCR